MVCTGYSFIPMSDFYYKTTRTYAHVYIINKKKREKQKKIKTKYSKQSIHHIAYSKSCSLKQMSLNVHERLTSIFMYM